MARGAVPVIAATLVAACVLGPLIAVISRAGGLGAIGASDWAAIRFTLWQSLLSALLSVLLAIPVARALARRRFPGRNLVITLLGAPFILPVIVAVLALLAVFGRKGLLNEGLALLGLPEISIYGLQGVVLAHVFFNMPLAVRMLLQGWQAIPAERFRLAASLNMGPGEVARFLERPMLRQVVPGALMVIFAICLSSFAVALTLGGGPRATTVELAIYQAFRFDFDLGKAATLSLVQLLLVGLAATLAIAASRVDLLGTGLDRVVERPDGRDGWTRTLDGLAIALACAFLLLPLAMIVMKGLGGVTALPVAVWAAAGRSVLIATAATLLTLIWAVALGLGRSFWPQVVGSLALAASSLVMGTGAFLILNRFTFPQDWALWVVVVVNALMALPFALRIVVPAMQAAEADFGRLADMLGMTGWARLRWLLLGRIQRPLGFAAGLTAALSMGDLGVIALFADPSRATLPLQMYRLMGSYQLQAAASAGLLLLLLSLGVFWICDRLGRGRAET